MSLKTRFDNLPLFWKVYIIIVALLVVVVALAEFVLENLAEMALTALYGPFLPWHEFIIWIVSILIPSLACGYILSRHLSKKLEGMATASQALARGNLEIRLPTIHNDKDDFDKLARSFNEMADAIDRQLQNERRLLIDISHELRSPLTRMTIATELLLKREESPENTRILTRLEKELLRMNELVELLLSQSPNHAGREVATAPVDLHRILLDLAQDFSFQGQHLVKAVICRMPQHLMVRGNAMLLQRMAGNILSNALFYTPPGTDVLLTAEILPDHLKITVRDSGPGVPEESLEDIFRAFYRVDSARARIHGGAGLGLALAREAVFAHKGYIQAKNAHPGLEVTVFLPLDILI